MVFFLGFVLIFGMMVLEDYKTMKVDVRWVFGLGCWVMFWKVFCGQGGEALWNGVITGIIGVLLYLLCRKKMVNSGGAPLSEEELEEVYDNGLSFLPSLAVAMVLWFFVVPKEVVMVWFEGLFVVLEVIQGEFLPMMVFVVLVGFVGMRLLRVYQEWGEEGVCCGFGDGDVLVSIILGIFLGWQGFIMVFCMGILVNGSLCLYRKFNSYLRAVWVK